MNKIELRSELHNSDVGDKVFLVTALYIDNEPLVDFSGYATFLQELERSTLSGGNYFIITCWCGSPECAGIYQPIQVIHKIDTIHWIWSQPGPQRKYEFDTASYIRAVETGIDQIRNDVKDLWTNEIDYKDQEIDIVPDFNVELITPKVKSKIKRRHRS